MASKRVSRAKRMSMRASSRAKDPTALEGVGALRVLSSIVSGRYDLAAKAGLSFEGKRDVYTVLGYDRVLDVSKFRARYTRNGIARRVVEAGPKATWRGGAELIEDDNPEVSTQFEEEWVALDKRLHIWANLLKADILAGIGRYSVVLIGAPGDITEPMPDTLSADKIIYLQPYSESDAAIQTWDEDINSERYGLPVTYSLNRTTMANRKQTSRSVHFSRVLHIACDTLDERVYGQPRLESVWNDFDNLEKVVGGGAEAFWKRVDRGMLFNLEKDMAFNDPAIPESVTAKAKFEEQMSEYQHNFRRYMTVRGMEVKELGGDVAPFSNQSDSILTLIAGATGIPKRILLGSERGELSSMQDATNWDTQIADRRQEFAEPFVVHPLVDLFIKLGVLTEPKEWKVKWPELVQMDENGKATLADKYAGLNSKVGDVVITAAEIRNNVLGMEPLTDEQKAEIEEKKAASVPPAAGPVDENGEPIEETSVGVVEEKGKARAAGGADSRLDGALGRLIRKLGGAGSGNFGHGGRPGEVGGSSTEGGEKTTGITAIKPDHYYVIQNHPDGSATVNEYKTKKEAHEKGTALRKKGEAGTFVYKGADIKKFGILDQVGFLVKPSPKTASLYQRLLHVLKSGIRDAGGVGSGNFGHGGRPGEVGGSSTEGGESKPTSVNHGYERKVYESTFEGQLKTIGEHRLGTLVRGPRASFNNLIARAIKRGATIAERIALENIWREWQAQLEKNGQSIEEKR
jgi:phage-related protein (TIGR01555 family)